MLDPIIGTQEFLIMKVISPTSSKMTSIQKPV